MEHAALLLRVLPDAVLSRGPTPTHWVCTPGTHLYPEPKVQAREISALSMGARLAITADHGKWLETTQGFVPASHLLPLGQHLGDPVAVAEREQHCRADPDPDREIE